jgi:hypothetical protein
MLSTTADIYTTVDQEQVAETPEALGKVFCGRSRLYEQYHRNAPASDRTASED